jgi:nucleoside-diphosphate-sugar epimerase
MNVFLTGASGYIGGSIAVGLVRNGHRVRGLVRSGTKAEAVARFGMEPVLGSLEDRDLLVGEAGRAEAVVNAADSDHRGAVEALLDGLEGSAKPLLHTSGSSIVADDARGEPSELIFDEDTPIDPVPAKAARVAIDRLVLDAAGRGVRTVVICNTLIYGRGLGPHPDSIQIPLLADRARRTGVARHVGRGLNIWSHVHVEDMADLYLLALARAEPGTFLYAENGEASFRDVTAAIAKALGVAGPEPWPVEEAVAELGVPRAVYSLGSNSRVRGKRSRALGWRPRRAGLLEWITAGGLGGGLVRRPEAG